MDLGPHGTRLGEGGVKEEEMPESEGKHLSNDSSGCRKVVKIPH